MYLFNNTILKFFVYASHLLKHVLFPCLLNFGFNPIIERNLLLEVIVRDNNVDQALKVLKKKMQREGMYREMKKGRAFEKPSEKKAREKAEAIRRWRKLQRKKELTEE